MNEFGVWELERKARMNKSTDRPRCACGNFMRAEQSQCVRCLQKQVLLQSLVELGSKEHTARTSAELWQQRCEGYQKTLAGVVASNDVYRVVAIVGWLLAAVLFALRMAGR